MMNGLPTKVDGTLSLSVIFTLPITARASSEKAADQLCCGSSPVRPPPAREMTRSHRHDMGLDRLETRTSTYLPTDVHRIH